MIWLIGAGRMAQDYYKVLEHLQVPTLVIGRSEAGCELFLQSTSVSPVAGGIEHFLSTTPECARYAIVAVNVVDLFEACRSLLSYGVKYILLEKPGALYSWQLQELYLLSQQSGATVLIAYNRRFYASVQMAKRLIIEDGGVSSFHFEMTEWSHLIGPSAHPLAVKDRWMIANTAHLIDLAFYLAGEVVDLQTYQHGKLDWHPAGAVFTGAGSVDSGAMFSYTGNWCSAGRWVLEICTSQRKLQLMPLEQLQQQLKGTVVWQPVVLNNPQDHEFKAGLQEQVRAFLSGDFSSFCDLPAQIRRFALIEKIAGYSDSRNKE